MLSPALAVTLRDLGLEGRVVARHGWDLVLEASVPVAGDQFGLDYEALVRARPTHVLLEERVGDRGDRLQALARDRGWEVLRLPMRSVADVRASIEALGAVFDAEARAAELRRQLDAALMPEAGIFAEPVLMLASEAPLGALGPQSYHDELLEAIGGRNALTGGGPWQELDAEDVLRLAPAGIILIVPRPGGAVGDVGRHGSAATAAEVLERLGVLGRFEVPAATRGRLAVIDHPLALTPSTGIVELAEEMKAILRAWGEE